MSSRDRMPPKKNESENRPASNHLKGLLFAFICVAVGAGVAKVWMADSQSSAPERRTAQKDSSVVQPEMPQGDANMLAGEGSTAHAAQFPIVLDREVADIQTEVVPAEKSKSAKAMPRPKPLFEKVEVIRSEVTRPTEKGNYLRVSILRTDEFKYNLVRVVERWHTDSGEAPAADQPSPATDEYQGRSAMVADHLMVQYEPGAEPAGIQKALSENQAFIRESNPDMGMTLVGFDGTDPRSIGRVMKSLEQTEGVQSVNPDYLTSNNPDSKQDN